MEYVIYTLILVILLLCFIIWNLLRRTELLDDELEFSEKYIESTYDSMKRAYLRMKSIDRIGSFESDDESGFIFKEIKSAMEQLNEVYELDAEEKNN